MQRIYLVGFMGCGKSFTGKALAKRLGWAFIDLDHIIEQEQGQRIAAIFAAHGENHFRELEREALHNTAHLEKTVISTGGGTPCFFDNISWMNLHGTTVFLDATLDVLEHRLWPGREKRPLLRDVPRHDFRAFIDGKLATRRVFYEQAAIHCLVNSPWQNTDEDLVKVLV